MSETGPGIHGFHHKAPQNPPNTGNTAIHGHVKPYLLSTASSFPREVNHSVKSISQHSFTRGPSSTFPLACWWLVAVGLSNIISSTFVTVVLKLVWQNIITPLSRWRMSNIRVCLMSDTRHPYIEQVYDVRLMSNIYVCIGGIGQNKIGWMFFFWCPRKKKKKTLRKANLIFHLCWWQQLAKLSEVIFRRWNVKEGWDR